MKMERKSNLMEQMMSETTKDHIRLRMAYKKMVAENIRLKNELELSESLNEIKDNELKNLREELFETKERIYKLELIKDRVMTVEDMEEVGQLEFSDELINAYKEEYGSLDNENTYNDGDYKEVI
ncbi:TPA: hypothetical protein ACF2DE_002837 [Clostridium perfringens]